MVQDFIAWDGMEVLGNVSIQSLLEGQKRHRWEGGGGGWSF